MLDYLKEVLQSLSRISRYKVAWALELPDPLCGCREFIRDPEHTILKVSMTASLRKKVGRWRQSNTLAAD